jgi:hypothetical protein
MLINAYALPWPTTGSSPADEEAAAARNARRREIESLLKEIRAGESPRCCACNAAPGPADLPAIRRRRVEPKPVAAHLLW